MTANVVPKPKWFRRAQSPGGIVVGKDVVQIGYGDPLDRSMNYDDSRGSYHVSQTGEIMSGDNLVKTENWDVVNHSANHAAGENYHYRQSYGRLREEGDEQFKYLKKQKTKRMADSSRRIQKTRPVPESPGFSFIMKENDCLDSTFDGIESYGCEDGTGEIFSAGAPPLSPIISHEVQNTLDGRFLSCDANISTEEEVSIEAKDCLDTTFDSIESYGCKESTGEILPASANPLSPKVSRELQQTLDGNFLSCGSNEFEETSSSSNVIPIGYCSDNIPGSGFGFMAGKIVDRLLGRENQPLNTISDDPKNDVTNTANRSLNTTQNTVNSDNIDLERNEELNSDANAIRINRENSILDIESSSQSRLEGLKQNKRAIEKERLAFRNTQTIAQTFVIPRDSLYENEEENIEEDIDNPISKLEVGSPVSNKQTENYHIRRKLAFIATFILISIGIVVLVVALFWPARLLR